MLALMVVRLVLDANVARVFLLLLLPLNLNFFWHWLARVIVALGLRETLLLLLSDVLIKKIVKFV